ncbi:hypothetical protein DPMN_051977 [Dreissena polymorpha]|uniref:Uncharacterized protein n=1 Tax=Dreissena polymorpha TaxID=45954 RepID=A0A9D4CK08_DREPO|nr:hypothetical protein DPMN_051977 [Dreissena polymorpha]
MDDRRNDRCFGRGTNQADDRRTSPNVRPTDTRPEDDRVFGRGTYHRTTDGRLVMDGPQTKTEGRPTDETTDGRTDRPERPTRRTGTTTDGTTRRLLHDYYYERRLTTTTTTTNLLLLLRLTD